MKQTADADPLPHLLTVAEYMTLDIEERTELLEGIVYRLLPKKEPHVRVIGRLREIFVPAFLGSPYIARFREPLAVSGWHGHNAPEIDVAIVARKAYNVTPDSTDAYAFIEVSDTTYAGKRGDRTYKIPLYVSAGVPSWIVNIRLRQVEFYGAPADLARKHGHVFSERDTFDISESRSPSPLFSTVTNSTAQKKTDQTVSHKRRRRRYDDRGLLETRA
jgi:hypothetical protein